MKFWLALAFVETDQTLALAKTADAAGYHGITVSDPSVRAAGASLGVSVLRRRRAAVHRRVAVARPVGAHLGDGCRDRTTCASRPTSTWRRCASCSRWRSLVSTASVLSGGRVAMGAAPGWCEEEFDQVGQPFQGRGARLEEMIDALRTLWGGGWVEHHGEHYDFAAAAHRARAEGADPGLHRRAFASVACAARPRIGDGWIGNAYTPDEAEQYVGRNARAAEGERTGSTIPTSKSSSR